MDRFKSCSNPFHVRVLPPDGQGEHFKDYLSDRLITLLGQPVQQAAQTQCSGFAPHMRRLVFYVPVPIKEFQCQSMVARDVGSKKCITRLNSRSMQIRGDTLLERPRRSRLFSQQPRCTYLSFACVSVDL